MARRDQTLTSEVSLPPRYQLKGVLKESPTTCVYRVFDAADHRDEAIKILRQEFFGQQELLQFKTEFRTLATLDHPNIIKVHDFGLLDERYPYFSMEFISGQKITDLFDGKSWDKLYDVLLQIASGLHHIHHLGIVHLDLKPSNILVDNDGRVKIMDFGVAAESRQVFDRRIRGTLHYMAPEVLRQDKVDFRADLYGLGMTMYETITGALPTYGRPPIEIIRFHLDEEVRRPTAINPNIPEPLEKIILKLLEKDPRHRYPSAAALLHDVAAAAGVHIPPANLLVGSGDLLSSPLIGRGREITSLTDAIAAARDGAGGGVLVLGAEGMGKSRIVREATLRAQLDGAKIFAGRCPVNRKSIYAPFFEIFGQILAAVNPDVDAGAEIRRILRPVSGGDSENRPMVGQKFRLYNRIVQSIQDFYGFLNAVGSTGSPLVLVIEDLQWADPATAELFAFLMTEAKSSHLLVIGTLTTDRIGDASSEEMSWLQRAKDSAVLTIQADPLTEDQVRENAEAILGETSLPNDFVKWIMWESGGSPLHVRRIIDYLIGRSLLRSTPDGWVAEMEKIQTLRIPGGAGAIWNEKLESLSPQQRDLLEVACVLGEVFDLSTLTAVVGFDKAEETYLRTRELAAMGLLEESADRSRYAFPQVSLRETIYAMMQSRKRAEVHQRAAEILEKQFEAGGTELLGQVSYHYARGTDHQKAIEYSIRAGGQASAALAHEQAAEFYRMALEMMDLSGDEQRKPEIRECLGDAYYRSNNYRGAMQVYQFLLKSLQARRRDDASTFKSAGIMKKIGKVLAKRDEFDAALSYFQNASEIYQRLGTPLDVAEMLNRIAWIRKDQGDLAEAQRIAEEAEKLVADQPLASVHGYIQNALGVLCFSRGEWLKARPHFEDGARIAEEVGSEQLLKVTTTNLGNAIWKLGLWEEALLYFRKNLEKSESEGDLWDLVTHYNNVAIIEFCRGNFHAAAAMFEKSVRIDEKLGSPENEALAQENLGESYEMLGQWQQARDRYERCLSIEGFDESRVGRITVYVPLARLLSKMGDIAKALQYAQKAFDAAERVRDEDLMGEAALVLAQIERERENYVEATRYLKRGVELFELNETAHGLARAYTIGADLAFRQQNISEAAEYLQKARAIAEKLDDRFTLAIDDWIEGKIKFFNGDRPGAEAGFAAAQATFEELDTPYELGRLLFDLGLIKDDPDEASGTIRRAIKVFERLQATPDLERARGALFRIKPTGRAPETNVIGLYEIVKIINSTLNLEEVLNRVLDIALKRVRAERGMIILIDPITNALRTRVVRNIKEGGAETESKRSPQAIIREVIQSGHSIISADARTDERFIDSETVISENIVSTLCVPLVIRERIAGAIYVDHREARHLFSQRDLNFLEAFSDQAAIAIENARLYEELESARVRLSLENESLRKEVLVEKHLDSIVGNSEAVARTQFTIRKAAASHSTVLVRGESGTGKGLVARIIHNISSRRNGAFIKFNCAALPETLAESELFGHEKGAFTGADRRKLGRFELANGGTIFLDEIGKVSLAMQAKLLRVVEDKEFERVGGTQTIKTDVKIIAATNLDIERAIQDGTFREDLYYRLNIIPIVLAPLRDRKEDIPLLAEHFIRKICRDLGIDIKRLEPGILDLFQTYDWPGNVRELESTIHRAIVMSTGNVLTRPDFYSLIADPTKQTPEAPMVGSAPSEVLSPFVKRMQISSDVYDDILSKADRQLIQQALTEAGGKIRETARRLGLARNTLKAKLMKYNIAVNGE